MSLCCKNPKGVQARQKSGTRRFKIRSPQVRAIQRNRMSVLLLSSQSTRGNFHAQQSQAQVSQNALQFAIGACKVPDDNPV
jgi:hypothetical protein